MSSPSHLSNTSKDEDKECLISDNVEEAMLCPSPPSPPPTLSRCSLAEFQRQRPTYSHCVLIMTVVMSATVATVAFPPYLDAINAKGDAYCALLFTSLCITVALITAVVVAKIRGKDWGMKSPISWRKVIKLGAYYGLGGLMIFFSRDRNRVLCHLQDPLAAAVLPMAVVMHFFFSPKVDSTRKLFCLAAVIIGLFVCIDFQIWDEFTCHGHWSDDASDDKRQWTSEENAIWTIVYLTGLGLFVLFFTLLEREMKGDKPECLIATIALTPTSAPLNPTLSDVPPDEINEVLIQSGSGHSSSSSTDIPTTVIPYVSRGHASDIFYKNQILVMAMWLQFLSFLTILLALWTDLFSFLGKAGSTDSFNTLMRDGLMCHFSIADECGGVSAAAWLFILSSGIFFVSFLYLLNCSGTCSVPYMIAITTMSLPLSAFCWSFFKTDSGFYWAPSFTGETGFTVVGLPIMAVALGFYRYYAKKEMHD